MNFGKWIVVSMILFASFLGVAMWVAFRQEVGMISEDYYEEELKHSQKMDRLENARLLEISPTISVDSERRIQIEFDGFKQIEAGELNVLRPNDPQLDEKFRIDRSVNAVQTFRLKNGQPGLYRVTMTWSMQGKNYQVEQIVVL